MSPQTLILADPDKPFVLFTDASDFALGAVLLQDQGDGLRPVSYESRKLKGPELRYTVGEKELLAIVHSFKVWRHLLEGSKSVVMSDHNNLKYLFSQPKLVDRRALWLDRLQGFDFEIIHVPGKDNSMADALSRQDRYHTAMQLWRERGGQEPRARFTFSALLCAPMSTRSRTSAPSKPLEPLDHSSSTLDLESTPPRTPLTVAAHSADDGAAEEEDDPASLATRFRRAYESPEARKLYDLAEQAKGHSAWSIKDGRVFWVNPKHNKTTGPHNAIKQKPRLWVPDHEDLRTLLIREAHDTPGSGHLGAKKTLAQLAREFYWQNMSRDVYTYTSACHSCATSKSRTYTPGGLQPLPVPERKGEEFTSDFMMDLPETLNGHNGVWVIVDRLSKRVYYIPVRKDITAEELVRPFFERVVSQGVGCPKILLSDRDSKFTSNFWKDLWGKLGTKLKLSTARHPQTDGLTERNNRTLKEMLTSFCNAAGDDWDTHLYACEFAYNNSIHPSTGFTPFYLERGQHPRTPLRAALDEMGVPTPGDLTADELHETIQVARGHLETARERMKSQVDPHRRLIELNEGDQAYISSKFLSSPRHHKFAEQFYGPYRILKKWSPLVYEMDLPDRWKRTHPKVNIEFLKPCTLNPGESPISTPAPLDEEEDLWEIEVVLDERPAKGKVKRLGGKEYYVAWKGFPPESNSWIHESQIPAENWEATITSFHKRKEVAAERHARRKALAEAARAQPSDPKGRPRITRSR